ncbi:uncharacterized protein CIMG_12889 [Coccidioides immitis RS]|uniref:Uncharacterized protein n=1 Tax=Coccidioides immitis (strain RS) TaxID=246410 RepID=A0A0D8JTP6_COCIM|nr:uncharacterized protein CIMG_12889 [Coccidioides immitis RS]KJF60341.1 hypothetical protein CIMG_12889 [Coccidioides immitis RS]
MKGPWICLKRPGKSAQYMVKGMTDMKECAVGIFEELAPVPDIEAGFESLSGRGCVGKRGQLQELRKAPKPRGSSKVRSFVHCKPHGTYRLVMSADQTSASIRESPTGYFGRFLTVVPSGVSCRRHAPTQIPSTLSTCTMWLLVVKKRAKCLGASGESRPRAGSQLNSRAGGGGGSHVGRFWSRSLLAIT